MLDQTDYPGLTREQEASLETEVVELVGEIDISNVSDVRARLRDCLDRGVTDLVLDLQDLVFIDSSGISALALALKRLESRGGRLRLLNPRPGVRKVLDVTGLSPMLDLRNV